MRSSLGQSSIRFLPAARLMSTTLFNVLFAWKCSSTHHKLALDALNVMQGDAAANWRNLCLSQIDQYLDGSKAPDDKFKDFRNHVLHVKENNWGGAVAATRLWYGKTVHALKAESWADAVYAAGVLSHYYTDPIQPFHTGQSEAEGIVHRAAEWSIACAYRELTENLQTNWGGWPKVTVPAGNDWLEQMVIAGAELANPHYDACIDHYNIKLGVKNPPAGLDQDLRDRLAKLIGHAVSGYARIMERALDESGVIPPITGLSLQTVFTQMKIPILWVAKKLQNAQERSVVQSMYQEFQSTGKVLRTLPHDDAAVRELHAAQVLVRPISELDREQPRPVGTAFGTTNCPTVTADTEAVPSSTICETAAIDGEPCVDVTSIAAARDAGGSPGDRFHLNVNMPVEKAPSIGPKTAKLLEKRRIRTVADLLCVDPKVLSPQLNMRGVEPLTIEGWQIQARLCCEVPNLRGHDAQILLACDVFNRQELAACDPARLFQRVAKFVATPAGERVLRGGIQPDLAEVKNWIAWAKLPRLQNAA